MVWTKRCALAMVSVACACLIGLAVGAPPAAAAESPGTPSAGGSIHAARIPWLIVSEDEPWSLALAAPVAARLQQSGPCPLLMAVTNPPTREAEWLLTLSAAGDGPPGGTGARGAPTRNEGSGSRPIVLETSPSMKLGTVLAKRSPVVLKIGSDPCAASAAVARHFWTSTRFAAIAAADDAEGAILGSALAAAMRVPLLLCERDRPGDGVEAALKELSVARLLVAAGDAKNVPHWIERCGLPCEIMPPRTLAHRLVGALGRGKIRNVVVARAPRRTGRRRPQRLVGAVRRRRPRRGRGPRSRPSRRGGRGRRAAVGPTRVAALADGNSPCRLYVDRLPQRGGRSQRERGLADRGADTRRRQRRRPRRPRRITRCGRNLLFPRSPISFPRSASAACRWNRWATRW